VLFVLPVAIFIAGIKRAASMSDIDKSEETGIPAVRVPKAVEESLYAPERRVNLGEQGITGAQIFANLCK
jgi:hypothetical protein